MEYYERKSTIDDISNEISKKVVADLNEIKIENEVANAI